jgi:hypothetical protein
MQFKIYFATVFLLVLSACTKFEDAEVTERRTFVHFYGSATNYIASVAELDTDGGFILSGEVRYDNGLTDALIIKTDPRGRKMWERVIKKGLINAIKPTANGYILAGDSIQLNPGSGQVHELVNSYAKLMLMDLQGNIVDQHVSTGSISRTIEGKPVILTIDYHGEALTVDPGGDVIMLGSFRVPDENESSFLSAFELSDVSDSLWYRSYKSLDHDLINCHALHATPSSALVWASNNFQPQENVTREYLSISYVAPNSVQKNSSVFGESESSHNHSVKDIQKSSVGYGAIGTYSETNGLNANMYFIRVDASMNVVPESARYIDGEDLMLNDNILDDATKTSSISFDEGLAITATSDGYVLAGAMTSTPTIGNGGKDILLVKLDPVGNLIWKKLLGGTGDEVIASIRETPDKGLLLLGTNTINGLSTLMLIKTDALGEIKD